MAQPHQLVGAQRKHTKHQVAHHFTVAPNHDATGAEFVLEARIGALGGAAFAVAHGVRGLEGFFFRAARMMVNQGLLISAAKLMGAVEIVDYHGIFNASSDETPIVDLMNLKIDAAVVLDEALKEFYKKLPIR